MNTTDYTRLTDLLGSQNPSDKALYAAQDGRCAICGCRMAPHSFRLHRGGYTVEHVFAHHAGRGHGLFANKVLTCHACNTHKGDAEPAPNLVRTTQSLYERLLPPHVIAALRSHHPVWTSA